MEKLYYTVGEVAAELGEQTSLVRFWSNTFSKFIKPARNAKGNRLFTKEDLDTFRRLHYLIKDKGLTLEGAARTLKDERASVDREMKVIDSLKSIRERLVEVKNLFKIPKNTLSLQFVYHALEETIKD